MNALGSYGQGARNRDSQQARHANDCPQCHEVMGMLGQATYPGRARPGRERVH